MKTFDDLREEIQIAWEQDLQEKLIMINQGKKYGQIVFLAGGAGSGKGFSQNFFNSTDFKIRDVDEMKRLFLKIESEKNKYPEIKGLNLRNPNDVAKLHMWVEKGGFDDKTLNNTIGQMKNKETLPNIVFDVTLKNIKKYHKMIEPLLAMGYQSTNVHLIWVIADYSVAVQANRERDRVVPDNILLQTHVGAHDTMWDVIGKGNVPKTLQGGIYVVLADRNATVFYKDDDTGKTRKGTGNGKAIIKDFTYLTFKHPGKPLMTNAKLKAQLYTWTINRVPIVADSGVWKD